MQKSMQFLCIQLVDILVVGRFLSHVSALLKIPGSELLFGGKLLTNHHIPACYGSFEPTAVKIPLKELLKKENFPLCTTEIFGPFQVRSFVDVG